MRPPVSLRRCCWLAAALVAAGCQAPGLSVQPGVGLTIDEQMLPSAPVAVVGSSPPAPPAPGGAVPAVETAPATPAPRPGGGGASGGGSAPNEVYLSAEGPLTAAGVEVPAGMTGEASLFLPGMVPVTLALPGGALAVHPRAEGADPAPTGVATVTGRVAGAGAGVAVQYLSKDRHLLAGGVTGVTGGFSFKVPVAGTEFGLVVARDARFIPRLAVARAAIAPDLTVVVADMTLAEPLEVRPSYRVLGDAGDAGPPELGPPPAGLFYADASVHLAEDGPQGPWRATIHTSSAVGALPRYDLPGFEQVFQLRAVAASLQAGAEISGPPGGLPAWLSVPSLAELPDTLTPGQVLTWGAVADAKLYTLRLSLAGQEDTPVWEGATTRNRLTLPSRLAVGAAEAVLRVEAWDATGVSIYSVASLRQLRIPSEPTGAIGRHSWALKAVRLGG